MWYPDLKRSDYLQHIQTELRLAGFYDKTEPEYEENKQMADHLLQACEHLLDARTPEYSLFLIMDSMIRLLTLRNLAPITSDPREWQDISHIMGVPMWQNTRNPYVYSRDAGEHHFSIENTLLVDKDGLPRQSQVVTLTEEDFHTDVVPSETRSPSVEEISEPVDDLGEDE